MSAALPAEWKLEFTLYYYMETTSPQLNNEIPNLPKLIHPQGPESARLMIVTDSPTEDEGKSGKLFSGNYTQVIKGFLNEQKINIESTYRTSLFKERLIYNGNGKKQFREACNLALTHRNYRDILIEEISAIRPLVITPLGEISFGFITGERTISNFRGSVLPIRSELIQRHPNLKEIKVIPSLPPKDIYADPACKVYTRLDYQRIASILNGKYTTESATVLIPKTLGEALEWFHRYQSNLGVLDIETRFSIPVCIGFAFNRTNAMVLPLLDSAYDNSLLVEFWLLIDKILKESEWVNQNMKFDLHRLRWFGFPDYRIVGDTALRSSIIYPEFEKKLAFLNSIYTDMPYFKGEGKDASVSGDRTKLYTYCGKDCISTFRIYEEQKTDLKDMGLVEFEQKVQNLFWPYVRIERRGIRIDDSQRQKLLAKYTLQYQIYRDIIRQKLNIPDYNPNSADQNRALFYDRFRLPVIIDKKTGQHTTNEEAMDTHCAINCTDDQFKYLVLSLIRGCKKIHKVIEALETPTHPDNRMRCSYDLGGTRTGRSAAKKVPESLLYVDYTTRTPSYKFSDIGHSLQTFGKHEFYILGQAFGADLRSIFVPSPGFIFTEGDLSQAEARADCVLAEDWDFLPEFDKKPGVHCLTGSWVYECAPEEIKKGTEQYHIAKIVRHAGERNMYPSRLALMIQKDIIFCTELLEKFHARQPRIRSTFHQGIRDFVLKNRLLITPHGRRRDFFGTVNHELYNEAISFIPQGTVSDQIKFSIPLLEESLRDTDTFFIYEGHDALMAEIRKDELERYAETFRKIVERPIDFNGCSLSRDMQLTIPCELEWSDENWCSMRKI